MNGVEVLVPIAFFAMITALVLGVPLVRAIVKKQDSLALRPASDQDTADRIARMEATLDAVALEVERISEGQRFVTKLLAERESPPAALSRGPEAP